MPPREREEKGFSTKSVHAGEKTDRTGAVVTPIYETSVFAFSKTQELLEIINHKKEGTFTLDGTIPLSGRLKEK